MRSSNDLYVDLGTTNTLIYGKGRGLLLDEPSMIAFRRLELFGIGHSAKKMFGKTPQNISIRRPLREGVIADFDTTAKMLYRFLKRVRENHILLKPRIIISLPCEVTEFEKNAVREAGYGLGAGQVYLLDEPMAAAIGSGLPVLSPKGQMVVDIGGGTTEIALISLGGIVNSMAVRVGGDHLDEAISMHLRNNHNFVVGEPTAERIKMVVGHLDPQATLFADVGGYDLNLGLPRKMKITSQMVLRPIEGMVREIIVAIKQSLEITPPELAGDIAENGLVLAGGGALLQGLADRLVTEIGIPVQIAQEPLLSVARGGAQALEDSKLFDGIQRPA